MNVKKRFEELSIFGAPPTFAEKLHVGRPNIGNREKFIERMNDLLERRWLTNNGPYVQEFEKRISEKLGVKNSVAMCNATVALEILVRALDMKGEVLVPSFTFVATAHALCWQEIKPIFCDIDRRSHNLDPAGLAEMITPLTTGIIGVHLWGRPAAIDELTQFAESHKLTLVFDAAHAFGCSYKGRMIGNFGRAEVFSFHATKFLNSLEGGVVTTNDDQLAEKIRLMKNFGFRGFDNVVTIGTNGKMNEACAAMGVTNIEAIDRMIEINRKNYESYRDELRGIPGIELISYDENEQNNYQYIVIEIDPGRTKIDRDSFVRILQAENVLARRYFFPGCHRMEFYKTKYVLESSLPVTEKVASSVLILPTGESIHPGEIHGICQIIRLSAENAEKLKGILHAGAE